MNKSTAAAIGGIVLESYNNTLYGYFAVILAPLFFSLELGVSPIIGSFTAFAAGYVGRPFGGVLFGYLGDIYGRRLSLTISSLLTTLPTLIIGALPTYSSIGVLAPILLIICRLLQGVAVGGDYTGALIYVTEQKGLENKTFVTCLAASVGFFGASIGVIVSLFSSTSLLFSGSWRYSFFSAAVVGLYVAYMRWNMDESPSYTQLKRENTIESNPILTTLRKDKKKLFASVIFGGANFVPIYLATVYVNLDLKELLFCSNETILLNNLIVFLSGGVLAFFSFGVISKFGELNLVKACLVYFLFLTIPVYIWVYENLSFFSIIILQVFLMIGDVFQITALAFILPKLFPTNRRYSGMGFSYALGTATLGGMTPLIASWIVSSTHLLWAPGIFLVVTSLFYWLAIYVVEDDLMPA
jgi:MHS family proline/betaine transporter-like MFS transporter